MLGYENVERDHLSNNNLIYTKSNKKSGLHKNILGRFSFISQSAIKLAQCQVSASFWISLAANGNQPKSNQNTLLSLFDKKFSAEKHS